MARALTPTADLFVSPSGNNGYTGTRADHRQDSTEGPLFSLEGARAEVRKLKSAKPDRATPIIVLLREGTYFLTDIVQFTHDDSGTEKAPIVYAAYPGEHPVLSGGVRVSGWTVSADGRWHVTLADVKAGKWDFAQLFVNGQRRFRPRLPKKGYWYIANHIAADGAKGKGDDRFGYPADSIDPHWKNLGDVEVQSFHPWFTSMFHIASVDPANSIVTFTGHTRTSADYGSLKAGVRFLVDNVAEALDTPGEWYLDKPSGELTYIPLPGEAPDKTEVIAPKLDKLLVLSPSGDASAPVTAPGVEHVSFRGLTFSHTNWVVPKDGYSMPQAAVSVPGAVVGRGVRQCDFTDCTFTHLGGYGLELESACQDDRIERCTFTDLGAGGIKIGTTGMPRSPDVATTRIDVRENLIAHAGRIHPAAVGVWIGTADHCTVEHNDVYDLYYTAFSVGWVWGYHPSGAHHNTIAWNHAHTLGQGVLSDMGAIYTLGPSPGTVIHHNKFHDITRVDYGGWGIYFDEGSTGIVAENNLVYRAQDGGFHQHYGEENIFRNNILADATEVQFGPTRIDWMGKPGEPRPGLAFTFEHNIVDGWGAPSVIRGEWLGNKLTAAHLDHFRVDDNDYWNRGKPVKFDGLSFEQWQKKGLDQNSVIADPLFADPSKQDYRLQPDSPALKLGFKPFDVSAAGRTKQEPADLDPTRWPRAFPPLPGPRAIGADFEHTPIGRRAPGATTTEENDRATVRVTDEVAFTGKRSLKFTDAPGQKQKFNPHIYWTPRYTTGTAVARFALRPERGAIITHEWRTKGHPYHIGPALYVASDGALRVGREERPALTLPLGAWTVFEITCPLGENAGRFDVTITSPGAEPKRLTGLACEPNFNELSWFGFSSMADQAAVFYLDDLRLELK